MNQRNKPSASAPKQTDTGENNEAAWSADPEINVQSQPPKRNYIPVLITGLVIVVAVFFGHWGWQRYMETPWTRDGRVRANVVTVAPQISGNITSLPVVSNQLVKKGQLLMTIEKDNYQIALDGAKANLDAARANIGYIEAQLAVQKSAITASQAKVAETEAALKFSKQQEKRYSNLAKRNAGTLQNAQQYKAQLQQNEAQLSAVKAQMNEAHEQVKALNAQMVSARAKISGTMAQLNQAKVNIKRTDIYAPVNGWVTNLLAQVGNYANAGQTQISIVDADSFWVDAYFEETSVNRFKQGDEAVIRLMGHDEKLRGHVGSISRAIHVPNSTPNNQGIASVNPIFTWVQLAQRIPVRIEIDKVADDLVLTAGMTATVEVRPPSNRNDKQ